MTAGSAGGGGHSLQSFNNTDLQCAQTIVQEEDVQTYQNSY
jgi:hypothetical protein